MEDIKVEWATGDPIWQILNVNNATLGKPKRSFCLDVSTEWARRTVLAEHSTLEWAQLVIESYDMRSDVCHQIVRHTKGHPRHVVQSQRPDWTGEARKGPESTRIYRGLWSPVALIAMARQRICATAMKETREDVMFIRETLRTGDTGDHTKPLLNAIGWAMVPECVYRGACPFSRSCGYAKKYIKDLNINNRYDIFSAGIHQFRSHMAGGQE